MKKTLTIDGNNIHDISSFYEEVDRVFMVGVDWKLGESLDALDDLFYGGYGAIKGKESITLIWNNIEKNQTDLDYESTREFYLNKLKYPERYNQNYAKEKLAELERGEGLTFFDIVLQIIADHKNIKLIKN